MKLALLTGGGDVPGLNPALAAVTRLARARGWEVVGVRRGWQGLVSVDPDDPESLAEHVRVLDEAQVRTIDRQGGTVLRTSRTNPQNLPASLWPKHRASAMPAVSKSGSVDATQLVVDNISRLGIDVLVPIGGDDTLGFGARISACGVPVVGIPKTMDNDVAGTDYCLGFATCVSRSVSYLNQLRTSVASHERFGVVEVMGRNCGATSIVPALLASVDRALIAEVPFDMAHLAELLQQDRAGCPSGYAMVTISEGASETSGQLIESGPEDGFGHRKLGGIGAHVAASLTRLTGVGVISQSLGYLVRSGPPDAVDVMVAHCFAALVIELIAAQNVGRMVCVTQGQYGSINISDVGAKTRCLDVDRFYDRKQLRPRLICPQDLGFYLG